MKVHQRLELGQGDAMSDLSSPSPLRVRKRHRRLDDSQTTELVLAYQDGAKVFELAERFLISRQTVSAILERAGVPRRGLGPNPAEIRLAVDLYGEGWSLVRIGCHLKYTDNTIRRALGLAGVAMRTPYAWEQPSPDSARPRRSWRTLSPTVVTTSSDPQYGVHRNTLPLHSGP